MGAAPTFQGVQLSPQFVGCGINFVVNDFTVHFSPVWSINLWLSLCGHMIQAPLVLLRVFLQLSNVKFVFRGMDVRQVALRLSIPA